MAISIKSLLTIIPAVTEEALGWAHLRVTLGFKSNYNVIIASHPMEFQKNYTSFEFLFIFITYILMI